MIEKRIYVTWEVKYEKAPLRFNEGGPVHAGKSEKSRKRNQIRSVQFSWGERGANVPSREKGGPNSVQAKKKSEASVSYSSRDWSPRD